MSEVSSAELNLLVKRIEALEAEADIRRLQARYMFLCDTPLPEYGVKDDAERIDMIMELYTEDAIWEGVGDYYDNQFGRLEGAAAIRSHFENFWGEKRDPELLLNVHYLTSEQIHVHGDIAEGQWVHCQPWIFSNGKSLLRSSRLNNAFRREPNGSWKITRTRTENVFVAPLTEGWAEDFVKTSVLMK
ncbi:nuclear transport factor 2 family protein [Vreelandella rituensis]|uniref:Nuclear transport factor 2 family protein n=1 Tax=Vreelandella rituensis TaxID=2282306 RepID=A0A368TU40_9GAMM|nr:nuclear transport factor 2 family protein [Halomonas rituensis]RCV88309.1 nuclear transport factor 2 family protein [Halomonas rituensis]